MSPPLWVSPGHLYRGSDVFSAQPSLSLPHEAISLGDLPTTQWHANKVEHLNALVSRKQAAPWPARPCQCWGSPTGISTGSGEGCSKRSALGTSEILCSTTSPYFLPPVQERIPLPVGLC